MTAPRKGSIHQFPEKAEEQVVFVLWDDSWTNVHGNWELRESDDDAFPLTMSPISTLGFLISIDTKWVAVAQSLGEIQVGHTIRIPKGCICDFKILNVNVPHPDPKGGTH